MKKPNIFIVLTVTVITGKSKFSGFSVEKLPVFLNASPHLLKISKYDSLSARLKHIDLKGMHFH